MKNLEPVTLKDECRTIFLEKSSLFDSVRHYRDVMSRECEYNGQTKPSLREAKSRVEAWRDEGNWLHYANIPHPQPEYKGSYSSDARNIRRQRKDAERAIRYIQAIGGTVAGVDNLAELRNQEQIAFANEMIDQLNGLNGDRLSEMLRRFGNQCRTFSHK